VVDSREHPRFEGTYHVQYKTVDELVLAYTSDLSRGGMFLRTDEFLPINAVIQVKIELPEGAGEVGHMGRVAYVRDRDTAATQNLPMGMGVEFLDLDAERMAQLTRFVTERQLDPSAAVAAAPRAPANVLVVDDDASLRAPIARALGERGECVEDPAQLRAALQRCLATVEGGRAALLEVVTHEEGRLAGLSQV